MKYKEVLKMNIEYIKYAVEIAKTKSINKASENLYISQPIYQEQLLSLRKSLVLKYL